MAESETHVAVSHEAEPEPEHEAEETAAAAAVATAGAAVALAHETAAHAELQAAEEIGEVAEEIDEWKVKTSTAVSSLESSLLNVNSRLEGLMQLEQERHKRDELLNVRLLELEERFPKSTPPPSENGETTENPTTISEADPLAATAASAQLGPAEATGSVSLANPIPSESSRRKRRNHWM